jgi:hypothetical protein
MRCNQFLPALTTGGVIRRWRANRHAARCPRCGPIRVEIRQLETDLSAVPTLTSAQRALWTAVADGHPAVGLPSFWRLSPRLAAAAALVAMLAFLAWQQARPPVVRTAPVTAPVMADRELDGLRANLDQLDHELANLRRQADLLDARREVDALAARFAPRERRSGL